MVRTTFLYNVRLRSYGGSKLPNLRILAYFSHTKRLKTYQPTAHGLQRRMIPIFTYGSRRPKGVPAGSGVFLRLAQIFAYGKWVYPYRMLLYGASDLDQRCLKTRSSKDGCIVPPIIFAPTLKVPQNPIWGPFNAKPIIERALRKSNVNGATKLKLYSYNGIDKYLGCVIFCARGRPGGAGPLM